MAPPMLSMLHVSAIIKSRQFLYSEASVVSRSIALMLRLDAFGAEFGANYSSKTQCLPSRAAFHPQNI